MHCSNFSDRIYVEKTPEQCSLNHHRSQRVKKDAWQDIYSSIGLDDGQMYDQDGLKENYIMWRTPHREEDRRKKAKEKRKSITVAWTLEIANWTIVHLLGQLFHQILSVSVLVHISNPYKPLSHSLRVQFFHPLSINLLYWAHWAYIPIILGLG